MLLFEVELLSFVAIHRSVYEGKTTGEKALHLPVRYK